MDSMVQEELIGQVSGEDRKVNSDAGNLDPGDKSVLSDLSVKKFKCSHEGCT